MQVWKRSRASEDDDYDGSSDDEGLRKRAFYVPDGPVPPPGQPPATAEEYLRMVRQEARGLAGTVVSDVDPSKFIHKQTAYIPTIARLRCAPCLPELLPNPEWQDRFGSEFAQLRQALVRYSTLHPNLPRTIRFPNKKDLLGWQRFLLGHYASAAAAAMASPVPSSSSVSSSPAASEESESTTAEEDRGGEEEEEEEEGEVMDEAEDGKEEEKKQQEKQKPRKGKKRKQPEPSSSSSPSSSAIPEAKSAATPSLPSSSSSPPTSPLTPLLSTVCQMDQIRTHAAINALVEFLEDLDDDAEEEKKPNEALRLARKRELAERLVTRVYTVWMWVLLARLDKPIGAAVTSQLRTLYRRLAAARATQSEHSALVIYCNMLMTIVDKVFGQKVL